MFTYNQKTDPPAFQGCGANVFNSWKSEACGGGGVAGCCYYCKATLFRLLSFLYSPPNPALSMGNISQLSLHILSALSVNTSKIIYFFFRVYIYIYIGRKKEQRQRWSNQTKGESVHVDAFICFCYISRFYCRQPLSIGFCCHSTCLSLLLLLCNHFSFLHLFVLFVI